MAAAAVAAIGSAVAELLDSAPAALDDGWGEASGPGPGWRAFGRAGALLATGMTVGLIVGAVIGGLVGAAVGYLLTALRSERRAPAVGAVLAVAAYALVPVSLKPVWSPIRAAVLAFGIVAFALIGWTAGRWFRPVRRPPTNPAGLDPRRQYSLKGE